jgi:glycosyltransferase involved in cell wall biosynthesis
LVIKVDDSRIRDGVVFVIPAFNEETKIADTVNGLRSRLYHRILVVDDGSNDRTAGLAREAGALVLRHHLNRGVGGAWGTGVQAALMFHPEIIVTFDADGQHDPDDVSRLIAPIACGEADVVIGNRMIHPHGMPWSRRIANRTASWITYFLFGVWTDDSQSGLRAISRCAAETIRFTSSGMEICSEMTAEIAAQKLRLKEIPIRTIYTSYSLSKGQSFQVGLVTLMRLVLAKARRSR